MEGTMLTNITRPLVREFEAYLDCLKDTMSMIRDEDWTTGAAPRNRPVHQACHCLSGLVGYTGADIDMSRLSFRFKEPEQYPSRRDVLAAIAALRPAIAPYVEDVAGKSLTDKEFASPPLFKLIYLLRHSVIHLSYMRDELSNRGYKLPEYSKRFCPRQRRPSAPT